MYSRVGEAARVTIPSLLDRRFVSHDPNRGDTAATLVRTHLPHVAGQKKFLAGPDAKDCGHRLPNNLRMNTPDLVGAGAVIRALCEAIGLVAAINPCVRWDAVCCRLFPEERILVCVIKVLTA